MAVGKDEASTWLAPGDASRCLVLVDAYRAGAGIQVYEHSAVPDFAAQFVRIEIAGNHHLPFRFD